MHDYFTNQNDKPRICKKTKNKKHKQKTYEYTNIAQKHKLTLIENKFVT